MLSETGKTYDDYVLPSTQLLNRVRSAHRAERERAARDSPIRSSRKRESSTSPARSSTSVPGPVVTTYEFKPDPGVKYSRVTGLVDDLCLALKAESIRIDRMPGKPHVGIEVPNPHRETIFLREVIESRTFRESASQLTIALGKTIDGLNYVADLAKMPHLLIAGTTGAGKSVGVNSLIVSILYNARPDEVKFILIDPKRLELGLYEDIPHLATPIIIDPKRAAISLKWAVTEMERRYKDLAGWGVRNIDGYNTEAKRRNLDQGVRRQRRAAWNAALHRDHHRRARRSDDDLGQGGRRIDHASRADGARGRHSPRAGDAASVGRCHHGIDQGKLPFAHLVPRLVEGRFAHDHRHERRRALARPRRHALPAAGELAGRFAFTARTSTRRRSRRSSITSRRRADRNTTRRSRKIGRRNGRRRRSAGPTRSAVSGTRLKCVVNAKRASTSLLQRHLRIGYGRAAAILDAMVREGYIGDMDGSTRARPVLSKAYEDLQDLAEMGEGS